MDTDETTRRTDLEEEARLRHPQHPVNNGFRMRPVPNLIVTRTGRPHVGERYLQMSGWTRRNIVWVHYTGMQRFLLWAGVIALVLMFLVAYPLVLGVGD